MASGRSDFSIDSVQTAARRPTSVMLLTPADDVGRERIGSSSSAGSVNGSQAFPVSADPISGDALLSTSSTSTVFTFDTALNWSATDGVSNASLLSRRLSRQSRRATNVTVASSEDGSSRRHSEQSHHRSQRSERATSFAVLSNDTDTLELPEIVSDFENEQHGTIGEGTLGPSQAPRSRMRNSPSIASSDDELVAGSEYNSEDSADRHSNQKHTVLPLRREGSLRANKPKRLSLLDSKETSIGEVTSPTASVSFQRSTGAPSPSMAGFNQSSQFLSTSSVASPETTMAPVRRQFKYLTPIVMTLRELEAREWVTQSLTLQFKWQQPFNNAIGRNEVLQELIRNAELLEREEERKLQFVGHSSDDTAPLCGNNSVASSENATSSPSSVPSPLSRLGLGSGAFGSPRVDEDCVGVELSLLHKTERLEMLVAPSAHQATKESIKENAVYDPSAHRSIHKGSGHTIEVRDGLVMVNTCGQALFNKQLLVVAGKVSKKVREELRSISEHTPLRVTPQYFKLFFSLLYSLFLAPPLFEQDKEDEESSADGTSTDQLNNSTFSTGVMSHCAYLSMELATIDWIEAISSSSGKVFELFTKDPKQAMRDIVLAFFHELCCASGDYAITHKSLMSLTSAQRRDLLDESITPPRTIKRERDKLFASLHSFLVLVNKVTEAIKYNHESSFRDSIFLQKAMLAKRHGDRGPGGAGSPMKNLTDLAKQQSQQQPKPETEDMADIFHPSFKVFIEGKKTILVPQVGSASVARLVAAAKVRALLAQAKTKERLQNANRAKDTFEQAAARREELKRLGGKVPQQTETEVFPTGAGRPTLSSLLDRGSATNKDGRKMIPHFFDRIVNNSRGEGVHSTGMVSTTNAEFGKDSDQAELLRSPSNGVHFWLEQERALASHENMQTSHSNNNFGSTKPRGRCGIPLPSKEESLLMIRSRQLDAEGVVTYRMQEGARRKQMDSDAELLRNKVNETNVTSNGNAGDKSVQNRHAHQKQTQYTHATSTIDSRGDRVLYIGGSREKHVAAAEGAIVDESCLSESEGTYINGPHEATVGSIALTPVLKETVDLSTVSPTHEKAQGGNGVQELIAALDEEKVQNEKEAAREARRRKRHEKREPVRAKDLESELHERTVQHREALPQPPRATSALEMLPDREHALLGSHIGNRSATLRGYQNFIARMDSLATRKQVVDAQTEKVNQRKQRKYLQGLPPELRLYGFL